jgi:metal-responsive CopG/Arc/MetJ family transcriptional regulator
MKEESTQKSKRMQLVIPEWLYIEIDKKAKKMGVNTSEAVREAIRAVSYTHLTLPTSP